MFPIIDTDLKQFRYHEFLLRTACRDFHQECMYEDFIQELEEKEEFFDNMEAHLSVSRYKAIHDLIITPAETIVVDCGCGYGLQQLLFQDCFRYIGVDNALKPRQLADNARFEKQTVEDFLEKYDFEQYKGKTIIGVSVWCGMCFNGVRDAIIKKFNQVINI